MTIDANAFDEDLDDDLDLETDADDLDDDDDSEDSDESDASTDEGSNDDDQSAEEDKEPKSAEVERENKKRLHNKRKREMQKQKARENAIKLQAVAAENNKLHERLALLENRSLANVEQSINSELTAAQRAYELANRAIAKAESEGDAIVMAKAMDAKYRAEAAYEDAMRKKQLYTENAKRTNTAAERNGLSAQAETLGRDWLSRNNAWIKQGGKNVEIAVRAIDSALAQEGYNPDTAEYWRELSRRCRGTFGHLIPQKKPPAKIPPRNASSTSSSERTKGDDYSKLPDSFKRNLEEAGFAPGSEQYKRAVANYRNELKKLKSN